MMTSLFWCDTQSRMDYQSFGDVVVFDSTYSPLLLVYKIDDHVFSSQIPPCESLVQYCVRRWIFIPFVGLLPPYDCSIVDISIGYRWWWIIRTKNLKSWIHCGLLIATLRKLRTWYVIILVSAELTSVLWYSHDAPNYSCTENWNWTYDLFCEAWRGHLEHPTHKQFATANWWVRVCLVYENFWFWLL
jgi:hypothetical protein